MMIGIYKITSPSGSIYIGQSWNVEKRFRDYKNLHFCKGQRRLYNSFLKHGVNNHKFEIIHELPEDVEQCILDIYEILYISQYKSCGYEMLNLKSGGSGGKHSVETKEKLRNSMKGRISPNKGKVMSDETKLKIRNSRLGKYSGKNHPLYGKQHSEETKNKMRNSRKFINGSFIGKTHSLESRKKISDSLKGNIPWNKGLKLK